MAQISAADVAKLRKVTGAGMMDCKKALTEAEGDFDKAIEIIRKKGQAIANKRADRETSEGVVLAKVTSDAKRGALIVLKCETDFVAKNESFVAFATNILDIALEKSPASLEALTEMEIDGRKIADQIADQIGVIGEKIELSVYESVESEQVTAYIHSGNRLATLVCLNKEVDSQIGKDVAMQVAAMSPVAVDEAGVPEEVKEKELEIGRDQARQEGKPENILDKIAQGKLQKFYKENTLLNQAFIKENKQSVKDYLKSQNKDLTVVEFKRVSLEA